MWVDIGPMKQPHVVTGGVLPERTPVGTGKQRKNPGEDKHPTRNRERVPGSPRAGRAAISAPTPKERRPDTVYTDRVTKSPIFHPAIAGSISAQPLDLEVGRSKMRLSGAPRRSQMRLSSAPRRPKIGGGARRPETTKYSACGANTMPHALFALMPVSLLLAPPQLRPTCNHQGPDDYMWVAAGVGPAIS